MDAAAADGGVGMDATAFPDASRPDSGDHRAPPVASIFCASVACGENNPPMLPRCNGLGFGAVDPAGPPCDLVVEVMNELRNGMPVQDLIIDQIEILVEELNSMVMANGYDVGFSIADVNGNPLVVDLANPLVIPVPPTQTWATERFKILRSPWLRSL